MPSKKKKYNARFPAGRIKKIMQTDEEVGKVAQAVPVIISKALEMFIESLLKKSMQITQNRSAKTLTPSHMKQCILSESRFDFLKDLVNTVPDASVQEDNENNALADSNINFGIIPEETGPREEFVHDINIAAPPANFYTEQSTSSTSPARTPVIRYGPRVKEEFAFPVDNPNSANPKNLEGTTTTPQSYTQSQSSQQNDTAGSLPGSSLKDNSRCSTSLDGGLCIDEDYDN